MIYLPHLVSMNLQVETVESLQKYALKEHFEKATCMRIVYLNTDELDPRLADKNVIKCQCFGAYLRPTLV